MKYGKQYLESLESVPEEWRKQAIEYRKLKKVINRVASELKDLGLTSEVLKELLEQNVASTSPSSTCPPAPAPVPDASATSTSRIRWAESGEDQKEEGKARIEPVEGEEDGVSEVKRGKMKEGQTATTETESIGKGRKKRRVRASYELGGTSSSPLPRLHLVFSSCSSESYSSSGPSTTSDFDLPSQPSSDDDELASDEEVLAASPAKFLFSRPRHHHHHKQRRPQRTDTGESVLSEVSTTSADATLEPQAQLTELAPSSTRPSKSPTHSRFPSSSATPASSISTATFEETRAEESASEAAQSQSESGDPATLGENDNDQVEFEGAGRQAEGLLRRMYGVGGVSAVEGEGSEGERSAVEVRLKEKEEEEDEEEGGDHETEGGGMRRIASQATLKATPPRPSVPAEDELEVQHLSLRELEKMRVGESEGERRRSREAEKRRSKEALERERAEEGDDEREGKGVESRRRRRRHRPRQHRREVFIPLTSDTEFLTLLASALNSLATLQLAQKQQFTESVRILADSVSTVSSPSRPKTDLYIWREIFALWAEAAIFESRSERDRGERSVEEVERKMEWFVDQVAKRKLAKRMKHKESRSALDKFIALNVELLDLKKFQIANEEAARKILKKHDKRTALTASSNFPTFLTSSSSPASSTSDASDPLALISSRLHASTNAPVLTLPGFPSLPHILLSTFTTTLLPIIPALEDYECSICGDVAFKPIRLGCGHKFCVRCLVKMQKRGQDSCPQCRSAVVLRANATNLDHDLQTFLLKWFPHEVKAKEKSNQKEAAREELEEMGVVERKCLIM
ncbi:hypothetical protein JCM11641_000368 [Rhodosporidiobolus odoratus]